MKRIIGAVLVVALLGGVATVVVKQRQDITQTRSRAAAAVRTAILANTRAERANNAIEALQRQVAALSSLARSEVLDRPVIPDDLEERIDELELLVGHGSNLTGVRGCVREILLYLQDTRFGGQPNCNAYMR